MHVNRFISNLGSPFCMSFVYLQKIKLARPKSSPVRPAMANAFHCPGCAIKIMIVRTVRTNHHAVSFNEYFNYISVRYNNYII